MIVISAGMQKAATATFFNLTNDLLKEAGKSDIRELRNIYRFDFFMTEVNCNIGPLRAYKLAWLSIPHWLGKSFVVKTHNAPSIYARMTMNLGITRATYIYRDPRDVALSLYEHGERLRRQGFSSRTQFDSLQTLEQAIYFTQSLLPTWEKWARLINVYIVRFEDFYKNMRSQVGGLIDHLGLELDSNQIDEVVARYDFRGTHPSEIHHSTHYHHGESGRWREYMTKEQIKLCRETFSDYLDVMGYCD
jgi:hypothetical protein